MKLLTTLALAFSLFSVTSVSQAANVDINLDNGKKWQEVNAGVDGWGDGKGNFSFNGENVTITVEEKASNPWHIQLKHPKVNLEKGQSYQITADVSASVKSPLTIIVQKDSGDYATYYAEEVSVNNASQTFSFQFKMPKSDSKAAFAFFAGGADQGVTYTFKNISLKSIN